MKEIIAQNEPYNCYKHTQNFMNWKKIPVSKFA